MNHLLSRAGAAPSVPVCTAGMSASRGREEDAACGTLHFTAGCSTVDLIQSIKNNTDMPSPSVRPVRNWRTPTVVKINLSLYTIVSLDTVLQTLTAYIWFEMEWQNEFISWNPDDFCGIKKVTIPSGILWIPDIDIKEMTKAEDKNPVMLYYTVKNDGTIINLKPIRIVSTCNVEAYKFPFDEQTCGFTFRPFVHSVKDLVIIPKLESEEVLQNSLRIYVGKGDWSLVDMAVYNTTSLRNGKEFSEVMFLITMKRATVVFIINLIVPACFLVLLDVVSMFIQMGSGERLGFKISVVLAFSVLLLILNNMLPRSDSPPILGIFCSVCLSIMIISIIGTVATTYMLTLSATKPNVPPWIRIWIMKHLARALCYKANYTIKDEGGSDNSNSRRSMRNVSIWKKEEKGRLEVKLLKRLLVEILQISEQLTNSKDVNEAKSEWYIAALVVDRLVLILYLIIITIMFLIVIVVWVFGGIV